ncbi:MAG: nitroreductase family protein [Candidatus Omnitrophica bacterium]|nr:nitroreductase family protein [Candidatus Omnitrophota bacterium]
MKDAEILSVIRTRASTRKYLDKLISQDIIDKILEAGIFGPSVVGAQPGRFIVVKNREMIKAIDAVMKTNAGKVGFGSGMMTYVAKIIESAPALIVVYNTRCVSERVKKISELYYENIKLAEFEAIAAAIQNMVLIAETLGVGTCWLDIPVLFEREINDIVRAEGRMVAIVTMGYVSDEPTQRSPRKDYSKTVEMRE